jgi:hypothetical protein
LDIKWQFRSGTLAVTLRVEESLVGNKKRKLEWRKNFKMISYSDIHSRAVRREVYTQVTSAETRISDYVVVQ